MRKLNACAARYVRGGRELWNFDMSNTTVHGINIERRKLTSHVYDGEVLNMING